MNHGPRLPSARLGRVRGWPCPELMGRRGGRRAGSGDGQTEQFAGERCLLDSSLGAAQKLCYRILAAWKQRIDFSEFHCLKCKTHGMSHGGPRCQGLLCRWGRGGSERAKGSAPGHGGGARGGGARAVAPAAPYSRALCPRACLRAPGWWRGKHASGASVVGGPLFLPPLTLGT